MTGYVADLSWKSGARAIEKLDRLRSTMAVNVLNNKKNCWSSSSDISGYHADFHEAHGTVGAWQGRGMACMN